MTWHPKPSLTVETLHWTSSNMDSVPLLSSSRLWDPDFQRKCKFTSSKNITLDHSAAVQSFFVFSPAETLLTLSVFKSGLTQGMRQLETHVLHTSVRSGGSTDSSCSSLFVNLPHIFEWVLFHNPVQGAGYPYCLYTFFLPHLFIPFASLLMCLDTELWEQPDSFAMTFCVLPSLCKVSMVVFWTTVKSAVFPHDCCSLQN